MLRRRRSRRAAAVVGLLAGLALLLGAVLDGGMGSPTRADLADAVAAGLDGDVVAGVAQAREDHPSWGHSLPTSRIAVLASGLTILAVASALVPPAATSGPRRRTPALLVARHRGPPVLA